MRKNITLQGYKMLNVNSYFSTFIGQSINPNHKQIENKLVNRCYELQKTIKKGGEGWISDETYNTDKTYNVSNDIIFSLIILNIFLFDCLPVGRY